MRHENGERAGCEGRAVPDEMMNALAEGVQAVDGPEEDAARGYVLDRCAHRLYIDRGVVRQMTGWDAPRINRFVSVVQDALWLSEGRRSRGRPRTNQG